MRERFFQFLPWLVLALALTATGIGWRGVREDNRRLRSEHFQRLVDQTQVAISDRIDTYSNAHYGGAALFRHSEVVTRREWRQFVDSLDLPRRHPGVAGVGHVAVVEARDRERFEASRRALAYPGFRLQGVAGKERTYPIAMIEPIENHGAVLGLDLGNEAGPFEAMERSRDSGAAAMSQRVILFHEDAAPAGFFLFLPMYESGEIPETLEARRRESAGWIYAPFATQAFVDGLFTTTLEEIRSQLSLEIYSGEAVSEDQRLYRSPGPATADTDAGGLRAEEQVALLGQVWTMVARPGVEFADASPAPEALRTLALGLAVSFALFGLVFSITRTRSRALILAHGMTRDLEVRTSELVASNAQLAEAVETAATAADALLEQHETLARTERMAAVGEMAGGLAHEIRNPLAGIQMSLENLRKDIDDAALRERFDPPIRELGRLARLLTRYLSPLRHVPEAATAVDVRELVDDLCTLLRYRLPANIALTTRIDDDIRWPLPKDRIRQSLLNLVLNAMRAMANEGGEICVSGRRNDGNLELCVEDEGPGFSESFLGGPLRRFESQSQEGTGLGLAMVQRVASDLGGRLVLDNRVSGGARVRVILPAAAG